MVTFVNSHRKTDVKTHEALMPRVLCKTLVEIARRAYERGFSVGTALPMPTHQPGLSCYAS